MFLLEMTPKAKTTTTKISSLDSIKLKSFYTTKSVTNKVKGKPTEWEKIFANYVYMKKLSPKYLSNSHTSISTAIRK
jgi:hypothetical protein